MIYICFFTASTLFFLLAEKVKISQRHWVDFVGIFLLCFLAGSRAITVGMDTQTYLQPSIKAAIQSSNFSDYWNSSWLTINGYRTISQYEIGYVITVWTFSRLFKSIEVVQFVMQLLVIAPIYYVLRHTKKSCVWVGMLTYSLLFFNGSLNLIRQSIACAFSVLALFYWQTDKRKSVVSILVGILFHRSGLIAFLVIVLHEYIERKPIKKKKQRFGYSGKHANLIITILIGTLLVTFTGVLTKVLSVLGFSYYLGYLGGGARFLPNQIIYRLPGLILVLLNKECFDNECNECDFYVCMIIYSMLASQFYGNTMVGGAQFGGRINQYFGIFNVVSYSRICFKGKYKTLTIFLLILYMLLYWFVYYYYNGIDSTIPYLFNFS